MKKPQRSFVVEYKSGRQKSHPKLTSIWGNVDLKSVARDVEEEAMPFVADTQLVTKLDADTAPSTAAPTELLLTPPIGQHTSTAVTEETTMADEIDTMTASDALAVVEPQITEKKQRKPRAKKAGPEAATVELATDPDVAATAAPEKQKRGRKAKTIETASTTKRTPVKRAPKAMQPVPVAPTEPAVPVAIAAAGDEMADLLQLEEENQKLRKLLAEKLRAENADLRKRLKLD
ncbi:transcriptional regulator [Corticibacterium sp. UT-5YL-CI-8]|nr:transcriptional regulator [Tianweitania sp. UT-5YL-CI-8]